MMPSYNELGGGFTGQDVSGNDFISNCFASASINANSSAGFSVSAGNSANCFWTNSATSDPTATKVGNDSYFYDSANAPFSYWDTTSVWCFDGNSLPCLRWDENCCPPAEGMVIIFE